MARRYTNGGRTYATDRPSDRYVSPNAPRGRYLIVQWREGNDWIPAVREDLIDRTTDDTRTLPLATFRTPQAALRYIRRMKGLVHCGDLPVWRIGIC